MSNPYSSVSVSGYNASPPADDGSEVASNALLWQNHLDKIGGPLKTAIEGINTNVQTAFGLQFGAGGYDTKSANYVVVAGDSGKTLVADTANITFTLLAAATAGAGFPLVIINQSTGIIAVDGNASELINGSVTIYLEPNESIMLNCNGSAWVGHRAGALNAAVLTATASRTSTTTPTTALSCPLAPDTLYKWEAFLYVQSASATPGLKITFSLGSGGTSNTWMQMTATESGEFLADHAIRAVDHTATITMALAAATPIAVNFKGMVSRNVAEQAVSLAFSQNVSNATATVMLAGSYMQATRLGAI